MSAPSPPQRVAVVIDDDPDAREVVMAVLTQAGFACVFAGTGPEGIRAVHQHQPILTTLDIGLPGVDGFEVARQLRTFSSTYVVMISVRAEESDILMGLDAGADDYLVKPFRPRELRARVEAMLRRVGRNRAPSSRPLVESGAARTSPAEPGWIWYKDLRLHPDMWLCEIDGVPLDLTRSEFVLLVAVVGANPRVVTKHALARALPRADAHGSITAMDRRAVEIHMANLRRKLGGGGPAGLIETVRSVGYRMAR